MSAETDEQLTENLETTLESFLDLVRCDAGSVYTVRKEAHGGILKFEAMITRSINLRGVPNHLSNLHFRVDESSIVGKTAVFRKPLLLNLTSEESTVSRSVDERLQYSTRNIFSGL